jgi:NADPH:quinone reductase-like Zn-dependent oxidoreductase
MPPSLPTERQAWRRTDDHSPTAKRLELVTEPLPTTLPPTSLLIKVHTVSLNWRDANISNGGNPWDVIPNGIICNDAAGEVIAIGANVRRFKVGDRVGPTIDTEYLTHRSTGRSWLAANEDGVLATHIVYDEAVVGHLPAYLPWESAALIPCAGVTAWAALRGVGIGKSVLIQGESFICQ